MRNSLPHGWRLAKVGDFLSEHQDRCGAREDLTPLSLTKAQGLMSARERFGRALHNKDTSNYRHVRSGEVVLDPMLLWDGAISRLWRFEEGFVSPDYRVYRANGGIEPRFLDFLVAGNHMRAAYKDNARGTNTRRNRIARHDFLAIPIPLPPLPEQRKIAQILSSVDEAILATQAVIEQTRRVKQGLLQELLTKGIGHTRFKMTELGEIPVGWDVVRLGTVAKVFNGRGVRSGGSSVRLYKTKHIYDGPVRTRDREYQPDDELGVPEWAFLQDGDVLTPNMAHATIGRVAWLERVHERSLCDGQVMVIRTRDQKRARSRFLFDFLSARMGRQQLLAREVGSIFGEARGQTHLYPKDVETILLPLPGPDEQVRLDAIGSFDAEIAEQTESCQQLMKVKAGLLQDLLTGKVRVTV